MYLDTLKVLCNVCRKWSIFRARLVTVCAPPSSFIFSYFLTQQVSRYGNWTVIFPVCDDRGDKIKEDEMH